MSKKLHVLTSPVTCGREAAHRFASFAVLAIAVAGCASSQGGRLQGAGPDRETRMRLEGSEVRVVHDPNVRAYVVSASVDEVWLALGLVYQHLEVPVAMSDPVTHRLGNLRFRPRRIGGERLSTYLDCGRGITAVPNADEYTVTMSLVTALKSEEERQTLLVTEIDAAAQPRAVSGPAVHCTSKATLERRIAELVAQQLQLPPDRVSHTPT